MMEQSFRVEIADYLQLNKYLVSRSLRLKITRLLYRIGFPLFLSVALYFSRMLPLIFYVPVVIVFIVLWTLLNQSRVHRVFKNAYTVDTTGVCTIAITPELFRFQNPAYEVRIRWEQMSEVTQSPRHIIFMLLTLRSFIIPKNAFPDEEHARAFLEAALAYNAGTHVMDSAQSAANATWPPPPQRMEEPDK